MAGSVDKRGRIPRHADRHARMSSCGNGMSSSRVALRGNFPQPASDENDEIAVFNALNKLRIGVQSQIAGITGM